ncbi:MAG: phBC6A51 family helix-turn-helix protein [Candidatus Omnitrophota bacterium]|jgi:transposase
MNTEYKLTTRQLVVINHLICASSIEEVSRNAKVSKPTLYKWLKDEAFKAELKRQRDEVVKESLNRLKHATMKATEGLIKLIDSSRPELRRWVCKDIIDYALKSVELEDIEERLDKVERVILGGLYK